MTKKKYTILIIIFLLVGIGSIFIGNFIDLLNQKEIIMTITDKEVKVDNGKSKYLIYGVTDKDEIMTVCNIDNILIAKFNSSDIYGALQIGKTYKLNIGGFRVKSIITMYPNILSYEEKE